MMPAISHAIADWGTTSFRLWALDRDGHVLGERRSDQGLAVSAGLGFETVLESHLADLRVPDGAPVMMCGMVGSRTGWTEAAYLDVPVRLDQLVRRATIVPSSRPIRILPGIAQRGTTHPDVLRGEETQLLALAATHYSGLVCLPGTHAKWVVLVDGEVTGFATFMTGELFQILRSQSVIAPAVEGAGPVDERRAAFADGVTAALMTPAEATNLLFELRAGWLLARTRPDDTLARLSGLLIGAELAGAARRFGPLTGALLIAAGPIAGLYHRALAIAGATGIAVRDAEACVREGLHAAATIAFFQKQEALS